MKVKDFCINFLKDRALIKIEEKLYHSEDLIKNIELQNKYIIAIEIYNDVIMELLVDDE